MKRTRFTCFILLAAPLLLLTCGCGGDEEPAFTISKETTYVTEPLTEDGLPDYRAAMDAIAQGDIQPDENAYVFYAQALGPKHIGEKRAPRLFERLGVPLPVDSPGPPTDFVEFLHKEKGVSFADMSTRKVDEGRLTMERPWTREEFPDVQGWLESNSACLALIVEGSKRPKCYSPWIASDPSEEFGTSLPIHDYALRGAARLLLVRAMHAIAAKDFVEAWRDLLACHRLGRHKANGPTLMDALMGMAISEMAYAGQLRLLWELRPDAATLARMAADLEASPAPPDVALSVDPGERLFLLTSVIDSMRKGHEAILLAQILDTEREDKPDPKLDRALTKTDWSAALREINEFFDELAEAMRLESRHERIAAIERWQQKLKARCDKEQARELRKQALRAALGQSELLARYVVGELMRNSIDIFMAAQYAEDRETQRLRNLRIAIALSAYRADHGEFPDSLAALVPAHLKEISAGLFADAPPRYERTAEGYKLWSLGRDGRDDGGQSVPRDKHDDIAIIMPPPEPMPLLP